MREALGDELWEEEEEQLNFGTGFLCDFLSSFAASRLEITIKDLDA